MTHSNNNPVLTFVLNVGETIKVLWNKFYEALSIVSWGSFFLYSFLTLIIASIINLGSLACFSVLGAFILKCFFGKEDQIIDVEPINESTPEEK